ncbi:hypothetical protein AB4Z54_56585, partial [Streptomyces sp. MCAF7]
MVRAPATRPRGPLVATLTTRAPHPLAVRRTGGLPPGRIDGPAAGAPAAELVQAAAYPLGVLRQTSPVEDLSSLL